MTESGPLTSLRNDRKACYFWLDNEVVDCYQPIVGADAIWVYSRIARNAHGAWIISPKRRDGDTRLALREMAEWCGKSVDTVWRCLQVLEHVGLLRGEHGAKSKGRYALVDVKELVTREGAHYVSGLGSYRLPDERVAELKAQVKVLRAKLARKKSGQKDAAESVAQSDRLESSLFSAHEGQCDRFVAPSDKSVAPEALPSNTQDSKTSKQSTPPNPPQAGACGLDLPEEALHASKTKKPSASVAEDSVSAIQDQLATATSPVDHNSATRALPDGEGISGGSGASARGDSEDLQRPAGVAGEIANQGECGVAAIPFTEEQLAHLARKANDPEDRREWEDFYRMQNRDEAVKAAAAALVAREEAARVEQLRAELPDLATARRWVMVHCNQVEDGRKRGIGPVIEAVLAQRLELGEPLWETAPKMAAARNKFVANGEYISTHWGPVKFFKLGIWIDERGWGWNEQKLERERGARVGSAR